MTLTFIPYIITNGNGPDAVKFYEKVLGAEVSKLHTFGEVPDSPTFTVPPEAKDLIMHAHLKVENSELMLSDNFPGQEYKLGNQLNIAMVLNDAEKAKDMFKKLQEGGSVDMELQETDWSPLYGQVIDQFGVTWLISVEGTDK